MKAKSTVKLAIGLGLLSLLAWGCENSEMNKLISAQACLDSNKDPATVGSCENYIAGNESKVAYSIRCSIRFVEGGLTTTKIVTAFDKIKNSAANKEIALMSALALGTTAQADAVWDACNKSGATGLIYMAGLAQTGTQMQAAATADGQLDPTDPAQMMAAVNSQCSGGGTPECEKMATAITVIAESYCTGANATTEICADMRSAVASAGGDANLLMQLYLQTVN